MHLPKIECGPIQPLMPPRLLPIWKRSPWIALTMCRYSAPCTRQSTMSPTASCAGSTGATVQSRPESILPFMELPRGRNDTVPPSCGRAICCVAQPTSYYLSTHRVATALPCRPKLYDLGKDTGSRRLPVGLKKGDSPLCHLTHLPGF